MEIAAAEARGMIVAGHWTSDTKKRGLLPRFFCIA
jgi:hypothetical protein